MTKSLAGKTTLTHHEFQFAAARTVYEVSELESAGGRSEKLNTAYLGRLIASYAGERTLRSQNPTPVAGQSGLEAVTEDVAHDRYHLIDVFAAGARVYLVASEGPKGHEVSAEAKRFRDSFKLIRQ